MNKMQTRETLIEDLYKQLDNINPENSEIQIKTILNSIGDMTELLPGDQFTYNISNCFSRIKQKFDNSHDLSLFLPLKKYVEDEMNGKHCKKITICFKDYVSNLVSQELTVSSKTKLNKSGFIRFSSKDNKKILSLVSLNIC